MEKLLTIAIPTLNRSKLLEFTIRTFAPQIEQFKDEVEMVVCNNASEDNTSERMKELSLTYDFVHFHDCDDRVPLGDNFKRTVAFSSGKFVILWGDDDIPAPYLISYLLDLIKNHSGIELYYFNRLVGYEDGNSIKGLTVHDNRYDDVRKVYDNQTSFMRENFLGATFMSAVMFSKQVWIRGMELDTQKHYGYEFLGILYYGNKNRKIVRENFPLCIQRKVAKRAWGANWPKYALLGLPNMVVDLEKEDVICDGINIWRQQHHYKFHFFCYILLSAATNKGIYKSYCSEFCKYQKGVLRKFMVYAIIYCMPSFVYNLSRTILFKIKK